MHLLSTKNLKKDYVQKLFQSAKTLQAQKTIEKKLAGKLVVTLFYEASTRTRSSFEIAAKRLGCEMINLDPGLSSVTKGESLEDTAKTLVNLGANCVIIRHPSSGAAIKLASVLDEFGVSVINAGDGMNEHPTQALLDSFSLMQITNSLENKNIVIIGDCLHSRVARSNIYLLKLFGANIKLLGPPTLLTREFASLGVEVFYDLTKALQQADFLMVLRLQKERQQRGLIPSLAEYKAFFALDEVKLSTARLSLNKIKILHPGPVNRDLEISSTLADNETVSLISQQVYNGLYLRMAVLLDLLGNNK